MDSIGSVEPPRPFSPSMYEVNNWSNEATEVPGDAPLEPLGTPSRDLAEIEPYQEPFENLLDLKPRPPSVPPICIKPHSFNSVPGNFGYSFTINEGGHGTKIVKFPDIILNIRTTLVFTGLEYRDIPVKRCNHHTLDENAESQHVIMCDEKAVYEERNGHLSVLVHNVFAGKKKHEFAGKKEHEIPYYFACWNSCFKPRSKGESLRIVCTLEDDRFFFGGGNYEKKFERQPSRTASFPDCAFKSLPSLSPELWTPPTPSTDKEQQFCWYHGAAHGNAEAQHVIMCDEKAEKVVYEEMNGHLSVLVHNVFAGKKEHEFAEKKEHEILYYFACWNSCFKPRSKGESLRIVCTLADDRGNVWGRDSRAVSVCAAPQRDVNRKRVRNTMGVPLSSPATKQTKAPSSETPASQQLPGFGTSDEPLTWFKTSFGISQPVNEENILTGELCVDPKFSTNDDFYDVNGNAEGQHVIMCDEKAQTVVYEEMNGHLSVLVHNVFAGKKEHEFAGKKEHEIPYYFACWNSCFKPRSKGESLRIVCTLEDDRGNVLGRDSRAVSVCAAPQRDVNRKRIRGFGASDEPVTSFKTSFGTSQPLDSNVKHPERDLYRDISEQDMAKSWDKKKYLRVRTLVMFEDFPEEPGQRCLKHQFESHPYRKHMLLVPMGGTEVYETYQADRPSVVVPFKCTEDDLVCRVRYRFVCRGACFLPPARARLRYSYQNKQIVGRASVEVRVCAAPKRDAISDVNRPTKRRYQKRK
ncbi:unnamed protein product [Cyprideis torosa]|uniref:p53 DNA-binding domain-containing protein n=1 Tax=Cyprideis torosa TaxID=163714 RepID=A0A7R8ZP53_9CRUS|nr:unnamed protein product [Cyprideis torosa]CAG0897957.1 unnamed protein product [Cyprideis torosa]